MSAAHRAPLRSCEPSDMRNYVNPPTSLSRSAALSRGSAKSRRDCRRADTTRRAGVQRAGTAAGLNHGGSSASLTVRWGAVSAAPSSSINPALGQVLVLAERCPPSPARLGELFG